MVLQVNGMAKEKLKFTALKSNFWECRVCLQGKREVIAMQLCQIREHMRKAGVHGQDASSWVPDLTVPQMREMMETVSMKASTLMPGDALVLPPGWSLLENVGAEDIIGLRYSFVVPKDSGGIAYHKKIAQAVSTPSSHLSKHLMSWIGASGR